MAGRPASVASLMVAVVVVTCPPVLFHKMVRSMAANRRALRVGGRPVRMSPSSDLPWNADNLAAVAEWGRALAAGIHGGRWLPAIGSSDTHLDGRPPLHESRTAATASISTSWSL